MSTEQRPSGTLPVPPVESPLSVRELAELLIKHYGLHEGFYNLLIEFQMGTGAVGPNPSSLGPGLLIGISKVGLLPTQEHGPLTLDASVVNPLRKPRKKGT